jgi:hypothetical protein
MHYPAFPGEGRRAKGDGRGRDCHEQCFLGAIFLTSKPSIARGDRLNPY